MTTIRGGQPTSGGPPTFVFMKLLQYHTAKKNGKMIVSGPNFF
jgi:hypothetical protein